jgi:hypothetical protein
MTVSAYWQLLDRGVLPGEANSNALGPNPLSKNPEQLADLTAQLRRRAERHERWLRLERACNAD